MNKAKSHIINFLWNFLDVKKTTFTLVIFLVSVQIFAQIETGTRIEFERSSTADEEFVMFPQHEDGVVVLHSKIENFRKNFSIEFHKYDSTLTKLWTTSFEPDNEYEFVKTYDNDNFIYVLLKKDDKTDIAILRVDLTSGDKTFVEGNMLTNMDIEHFSVLKSKAFIGGKYNDRPVVVMYSMFDNSAKVLPEIHANHLQINDIGVNETTETIYIMMKNERNCQYILKIYNYEGKSIENITLGDKDKTPITGEILDKIGNSQLLTGSYAEGCSLYSLGLYLLDLSNDDSKIQYFSFADFNNFFGYLNEKRAAKMKLRIKEKKMKGKEVKLRYRLLQHEIIPTKEGWMMIAEIFYPEYKSPSNNTVFGNWRTYRIGNEMYNNFRYTHAIICSFDKNGKLLWDNSISLNNIESNALLEKVQVSYNENNIVLAYPDDEKIKTVTIQGSQKAKSLEIFDLRTANEKLTITNAEDTNLTAWFGNNFLAYGYQSVRKENAILTNNVFYINKLSYKMREVNQPNRQ